MATTGQKRTWTSIFALLGRLLFRFLGLICITIAWVLILGIIYIYFHLVVPLLVDPRSWVALILFIPSSWLSFNLIFNYALVLWTGPGQNSGELTDGEKTEMQHEKVPQKGRGWSKFCRHCKLSKPPRTHHCHLCGKCVLKMDHHCPWINNCVGHFNHRYFMLFITYLVLSCLFACATLTLHYFGCLQSNSSQSEDLSNGPLFFTFIICLSVSLAMLLFFGWNLYLIVTNQTTIEYHYNKSMKEELQGTGTIHVNPYDVGITRNLRQVFGPFNSFWELLLPSWRALPADGKRWMTIHDLNDATLEVL